MRYQCLFSFFSRCTPKIFSSNPYKWGMRCTEVHISLTNPLTVGVQETKQIHVNHAFTSFIRKKPCNFTCRLLINPNFRRLKNLTDKERITERRITFQELGEFLPRHLAKPSSEVTEHSGSTAMRYIFLWPNLLARYKITFCTHRFCLAKYFLNLHF